MRVLVTGASGFVGRHLCASLEALACDIVRCGGPMDGSEYLPIDLADRASLIGALELSQPDAIVHLAGQASGAAALRDPHTTLKINVLGTHNLLEAISSALPGKRPRFVFASTAEVYGARASREMPLAERLALAPNNPYGASKAAAEMVVHAHATTIEPRIIRFFNLIGPGQDERFVVGHFAAKLAAIAAGAPPQLDVGNLDVARDFLDVRDAADAVAALVIAPDVPRILNICSGEATRIRMVLGELIRAAHVPVEVREDPDLVREIDSPLVVGDPQLLHATLAWRPRVTLRASLRAAYDTARAELAARAAKTDA